MDRRFKLRKKNLAAFDYRGGKNSVVNKILPYIPNHERYIEPFFGSGAVLLNKKASKMEVANDSEERIMALFQVIRDRPNELMEKLYATPYSKNEFLYAKDILYSGEWKKIDELEQARLVYVFLWMNLSVSFVERLTANNFKFPITTYNQAPRFRNHIAHIELLANRLLNVVFENCCGIDLITRSKGLSDTFIYCDPPYAISTLRDKAQVYNSANRDEDSDLPWQNRFLDTVNESDAKILISGYKNPLYMDRLSNWRLLSWKSKGLLARTSFRSEGFEYKEREECLWMNYDIADPFGLSENA